MYHCVFVFSFLNSMMSYVPPPANALLLFDLSHPSCVDLNVDGDAVIVPLWKGCMCLICACMCRVSAFRYCVCFVCNGCYASCAESGLGSFVGVLQVAREAVEGATAAVGKEANKDQTTGKTS